MFDGSLPYKLVLHGITSCLGQKGSQLTPPSAEAAGSGCKATHVNQALLASQSPRAPSGYAGADE